MEDTSPFLRALADPRSWFDQADELLEAAKLIRPDVERFWEAFGRSFHDANVQLPPRDFVGVYFMLVAYATENLLKGALVQKHKSDLCNEARTNGRLPKRLKSHNLWELSREIAFVSQNGDEDLMRRLAKSAVWVGRYPVPMSAANADSEQFSDGTFYPTTVDSNSDLEEIDDLLERLRTHISA